MHQVKNILLILFTKKFFKKTLAYFLLIMFFYFFRSFLGLFLMVFVFSFLFFTFGGYLKEKIDILIDRFLSKHKHYELFKRIISINFIIVIEYIIFIGIIIFILSDLLPQLINELSELSKLNKEIPIVGEQINEVTSRLEEFTDFNSELQLTINQIFESQDYELIVNILKQLKTAGVYFFQFIISLILSFVFIIDRKKLSKYLSGIKNSSFSFLYKEYYIITEKIVKSFGLILKAQSMIAGINSILTIICLFVIGLFHGGSFPFLLTLGLVVFLAGFIPVLGVFISGIPIIIIAFSTIGGYSVIIEIILMILIVHTFEAYYLNPKIVSSFFELPVSLTFLILIISEHVFGVAGLLIGVSLFYFIIGLLIDMDGLIIKKHKQIKKHNNAIKTVGKT